MLYQSTTFRTILLLAGLLLGTETIALISRHVTEPETAPVLITCAVVDCPVVIRNGTRTMVIRWAHPTPTPIPIYDAGADI
jgi:hypothetical protein